MPTRKETVQAKAKTALPDSTNRPKTTVAGSTDQNTRVQPALTPEKADAAGKKLSKKGANTGKTKSG